jgi:hypothetical protein
LPKLGLAPIGQPRLDRGEGFGGKCDGAVDWTSQIKGFWQSRFDGLEDLLKRMDQ